VNDRERERLIRLIKAKAAKTPPLPPEVREAVRADHGASGRRL
jgi:hypothetical protein